MVNTSTRRKPSINKSSDKVLMGSPVITRSDKDSVLFGSPVITRSDKDSVLFGSPVIANRIRSDSKATSKKIVIKPNRLPRDAHGKFVRLESKKASNQINKSIQHLLPPKSSAKSDKVKEKRLVDKPTPKLQRNRRALLSRRPL
jgi:hypothetical protein